MRKVIYIDEPSLDRARKRNECSFNFSYSYFPSEELKNYLNGKKFFIRTYGCQANLRDEEIMSGLLSDLGMVKCSKKEDCDLAIINTCAIRENAEDKAFGEIGEFKSLKRKNKDLILMACGCMVEQKHIVDKILTTYEYLDIIFGTHNISNLIKILDLYIKNRCRYVDVSSKVGDIVENLPSLRKEKFRAFVNIAYGCDKFCTYCIVPFTRGKERSRKVEDIIKECKLLVDEGYKEITLLGQNVDSYGKDFENEIDFAYLLEKVAQLGIPRLRFLTSYPSDFKDDVIEVMSRYPNIMKFIHLPIQSGSNNILRLMARHYTVEEYLSLVQRIRDKIPSMAFSTDIIVGFPNESEEDFLETINLVKKMNYISAFTFIYSPRKGTPAAKIEDSVSYKEKLARFKTLVSTLEIDVAKNASALVDKIYPVLVEGVSKKNSNMLSGILENCKVVNFKGSPDLIGKIINVKITESHVYSLSGEICDE